jgi:DNA repair exonuclease SbcCD ATPase subunit
LKKIMLMALSLRNFKGVKEYKFETDGFDVGVFGDNATGKSTLFDGFNWALFDKDSHDKKDFQLKTVNGKGQELHGLEHEVTVTLKVDGELVTLKKVFEEKWTKTRGSAEKTFSGHTTKYYVNEVPAKKKEYEEKVKEIVDEDIFKLLTSTAYFNESLHWNKRRELLLEIAGDTTDEEVIGSNKNLNGLLNIISKRTIEDHKKMIAAKRSEINKELDRLPVRIDEVQRSMADTTGLVKEELEAKILNIQSSITIEEEELQRILSGNEVPTLQCKIAELNGELSEKRQAYREEQFGELNRARDELNAQADVVRGIERDVHKLFDDIERKQNTLASYESEREGLRDNWHNVNTETFDEHAQTCPTCKQDLPEEQKEAAKEEFNLHKSQNLANINARGKELKGKCDTLNSELDKMNKELAAYKENLSIQKEKGREIKAKVDTLSNADGQPFEETETFIRIQSKIAELEADIHKIKTNALESSTGVKGEIAELKQNIQFIQDDLQKFTHNEKSSSRIAELEAEEKELAKEFERIEKELFLIEEFTRTKVNLLEERINSKFTHAKFKLFEEQINGGLKEVCETLYEGVPYSKGLNNAAKINVGLDIINTLSAHYGVSAPIFIDNSEAVTKLMEIDSQTISLIVSEQDKTLRVEKKGELAHV